ncbi:hypothetical protein BD779DRAFT_1789730 [Infundibulicybe gibba]|nr:hypothetical protein BD779DRAFT_1789730 [Infundibulicybe gibba]
MPVPRASRRRLDAARTLAQPERLCRGGDAAAKPRQTMRHTASSYRRAHRGRSNSAEGKWPEEMGQLQLVVRQSTRLSPQTYTRLPARPGQRLRPAHTSTSAERKLKYAPRPRAMYSKKLLATLGRDTQIAQRA